MTTTLEQLLSKHPKAVKAVNSGMDIRLQSMSDLQAASCIHCHAQNIGIGSPFDSIDSLLAAIEAHITASEPPTDEDISAMKWRVEGIWVLGDGDFAYCCARNENAAYIAKAQHACIDRLHAEIKRLRRGES